MNGAELRQAGREAMLDPQAVAVRSALVEKLILGFRRADLHLREAGTLIGPGRADGSPGDDRLVGLGYVAGTAGELLRGIRTLARDENPYGAAAIARQVVEVEYLAWAFAEDQDEASSWLLSTHEDRLGRWQPRHLRERAGGRFRGKDYSLHCERGGHPTPEGCRNLLSADVRGNLAGVLLEAAIHGSSAWRYLLTAIDLHAARSQWDPHDLLPVAEREPSLEELQIWRAQDPMLLFVELMPVIGEVP